MFKNLREDIQTVLTKDPAARSTLEVVLCYGGFHAIMLHRINHGLWVCGLQLFARFFANIARIITGVEIHPAAQIGRRVFIDHGMGVVIGETAKVGDDVTLYQGVTLGGVSLEKGAIRHPQIGDGVVIGAGAKVLGAVYIGDGSRIGANAVVLESCEAGTTLVGIPARALAKAE